MFRDYQVLVPLSHITIRRGLDTILLYHKLCFLVSIHGVVLLVKLPYFLDINCVESVDILLSGLGHPGDGYRLPHHHVHRAAARQKPEGVLEESLAVEDDGRDADHVADPVLEPGHHARLSVQLRLAEHEDGHEAGAVAEGELDEALPLVEHEVDLHQSEVSTVVT